MNKRKMDKNTIYQTQVTKLAKTLLDKLISERGTVVFDFMISLQNIVMAKIVNNLWMHPDIQQDKMIFFQGIRNSVRSKWDEVENNIVAKISKLSLPHLISLNLTYIVPSVGKSICQWIAHFDEVLLYSSKYYGSKYSVDLISNIKWTARGKIDYAETARSILAIPDICLSECTRFKIACTYCLEDEIALLAPNVVNECFLDNVDSFMSPMEYFWSIHIAEHNIEVTLRDEIENALYSQHDLQQRNLSINEIIFQILIEDDDWMKKNYNEVAITYVWNKLTAEEKAKNITSLIKKMDDQGLKYTVLSVLEYEQQQDIFKECLSSILVGIAKDWSWEGYFLPIALHFLDVMTPSDFLNILKNVTKRINKNFQKGNNFMYNQYKSIFKELWHKCSKNLKDFVLEHKNGCVLRDFLISLSCKQNMDIIGLISNDLNAQQKKNLISGLHGIEYCSYSINDVWNFLELFLTPSLFSVEDVIQFKQAFIEEKGDLLVQQFLEQKALDKIVTLYDLGF